MQTLVKSIAAAALGVLVVCCNKNTPHGNYTAGLLPGKWNVVSDEGFTGIGQNNQPVYYTGQPGDYFDFKENGRLYIKESARTDTAAYLLTSDTTIQITGVGLVLNGVQAVSVIENLSSHTVTLRAATVLTPGGAFGRTIKLAR